MDRKDQALVVLLLVVALLLLQVQGRGQERKQGLAAFLVVLT